MSKYEGNFQEKNVRCPYCDCDHGDSWEYRDEDENFECGDCGKRFSYERNIEVTYTSYPDCELNNEQHEYSEFEATHIKGFYRRECSECGKTEYKTTEEYEED